MKFFHKGPLNSTSAPGSATILRKLHEAIVCNWTCAEANNPPQLEETWCGNNRCLWATCKQDALEWDEGLVCSQTLQWKRWSQHEQENGLVNNLTPAWIHDYIPAVGVDEGKNTMLASQCLNSTNLQKALCHVIILWCDDVISLLLGWACASPRLVLLHCACVYVCLLAWGHIL